MKTAIVYSSMTGHTKKYAEWLAEELGIDAVPYAERGSIDLEAIDTLVFCSWFHAASVVNAKWLKREMRRRPKLKVAVLVTGATPMPESGWGDENEIEQAFRRTFPEGEYADIPWFYCHGGFDFDKLDAPNKMAMRMFFKMNDKNAGDPKTAEMLAVMREGFDGTDRRYLEPLLAHIQGTEARDE